MFDVKVHRFQRKAGKHRELRDFSKILNLQVNVFLYYIRITKINSCGLRFPKPAQADRRSHQMTTTKAVATHLHRGTTSTTSAFASHEELSIPELYQRSNHWWCHHDMRNPRNPSIYESSIEINVFHVCVTPLHSILHSLSLLQVLWSHRVFRCLR